VGELQAVPGGQRAGEIIPRRLIATEQLGRIVRGHAGDEAGVARIETGLSQAVSEAQLT
jgi:hypothetical protein